MQTKFHRECRHLCPPSQGSNVSRFPSTSERNIPKYRAIPLRGGGEFLNYSEIQEIVFTMCSYRPLRRKLPPVSHCPSPYVWPVAHKFASGIPLLQRGIDISPSPPKREVPSTRSHFEAEASVSRTVSSLFPGFDPFPDPEISASSCNFRAARSRVREISDTAD